MQHRIPKHRALGDAAIRQPSRGGRAASATAVAAAEAAAGLRVFESWNGPIDFESEVLDECMRTR